MAQLFKIERDGQMAFFDNYGIPYDDDDSILIDNTDGVYNGCLMEFKLNISNLNAVLFQAIKYLSRMRVKGESVPRTILLVSLNTEEVYVYKSDDYEEDIHKIYIGAASRDNAGFAAKKYGEKVDYSNIVGSDRVRHLLKKNRTTEEKYLPISIDENCIVGWAERYYRENPKASKGDFLGDDTGTQVKLTGEIREPKHFKGLIKPYTGRTNEKFRYLMDCLNDRLSKKDLGAFYTPMPYCRKAAELVQMAVERVPDGNDYIILDRCAGTGNLEEALIGLYDRNGDELISHCIVSTYEYYEYKVLQERIGDKVRHIIPPTEKDVDYGNGKVLNADAMSEEYINNPIIRQYVDDDKCTVILFENPPYGEATTVQTHKNNNEFRSSFKKSYLISQMKREVTGVASNDMTNIFIWSSFKYYLRKETDSLILFSPLKYWKLWHLVSRKPIDGFVCNRKHFHASPSAVGCILFANQNSNDKRMHLPVYDINPDGEISYICNVAIQQTNSLPSALYDKRTFKDDIKSKVVCGFDGYEDSCKKTSIKPIYNNNIIGYLIATGATFENPRLTLNMMRVPIYNGHGFYLRNDNYIEKLPLFVAGKYPIEDNWWENGTVYKSSDGGDTYTHDSEFLKSCLVFAGLSYYNKCLSFRGSDGRDYQNELCFDNTNSPLALQDLNKMVLNEDEKDLVDTWNHVLEEAKKCDGYDSHWNWGVYQITKELNTFHEEGIGNSKKKVPDHVELNGYLVTLRDKLKAYYKKYITPKLFEYELLK